MTRPSARITGGYWAERLATNAGQALDHQWEQLEQTHCIDNFRLAAGQTDGFREGFFFSDSDAYKWLDAASRVLASGRHPELKQRVDKFIALLDLAQAPDGYLYTYNQIHFPGQRWVNLQLEHELYCMGHLIEAAISHRRATGEERLLEIARRAADLMVRELMHAPAAFTDGHEEIEIALIQLYRETRDARYLDLARELLERRGRIGGFAWLFIRQAISTASRTRMVSRLRTRFYREHPDLPELRLPPRNPHRVPFTTWPRLAHSLLSGEYNQQHAPIREQRAPVGHAVRFTYLATATAMLARETGDPTLLPPLLEAWERMVTRRMYVTGGLGALPLIEGFGRDDELDPEIAYSETCAALGSLLWNREMAGLTGEALFDDLFEWQLYNAASPGMGVDGCSYLYNNPLLARGDVNRRAWYDVPCCPSNLSRVFASLANHLYSHSQGEIRIHQYATSTAAFDLPTPVRLRVRTGMPWSGDVRMTFGLAHPKRFTLALRLPSWAAGAAARLNGKKVALERGAASSLPRRTASGVVPHTARWQRLTRRWQPGDTLEIAFDMPIRLLRQAPEVPRAAGQVAVTRGPIVYCLENTDNQADIFSAVLDPDSLIPIRDRKLFGGGTLIKAKAMDGADLTFLPYFLWGNRGDSHMTVFVRAAEER